MTLHIARLLYLLEDRQDWDQPRLRYLPGSLYGDPFRTGRWGRLIHRLRRLA